jgi:hypothetical protein
MAIEPRTFEGNDDWYAVTREFDDATAVEDEATIAPGRIEATGAPLEWVVTYEVADDALGAGAHVALEVPIHFRLDHGRPYPAGRGHVAHADDATTGYEVAVDVRPQDAAVEYAVSNPNRFSVIDAVIVDGRIESGETLEFVLGPARASRLRAPKFAQEFPFACGVDRDGDGSYRPVDPFPSVTVTGASPEDFRLIAPSTVDPGETFAFDLYPADGYSHNPATEYDRAIDLDAAGDAIEPPSSIDTGSESSRYSAVENETIPGDVYRVEGTRASETNANGTRATREGIGHVTAHDPGRGIAGRSNPVGVGWSDRDVYWGEIHVQGYDSIGVGTLEETFEWGRDVEGLDFCSTANHYGGRYPVTSDRWADLVATTDRYNDPGSFTTFVGFEGGGSGGDLNVYYRGDTGDFYSGKEGEPSVVRRDGEWVALEEYCESSADLWSYLDSFDGDAIAFPHHPRTAGFGLTEWGEFREGYQRLVEIYSAWGDSEVGGEHSVRTALDRGHRFGFTGGTDSHDGQPANGPHEFNRGSGLTAVYAEEHTRDGIFEALQERRTYATTGARTLLDVDVNGLSMGRERTATDADREARTIEVRVAGTREIEGIDVVRNGEVVATREPAGERAAVTWTDDSTLGEHLCSRDHPDDRDSAYYYVRVRQADRHVAWASPVWFLAD